MIGIAAGAINTIFILPNAFEENPDDLGLIRILLANATIFGAVFGFGLFNLIIRENTDDKTKEYQHSIIGYALLLSSIGLGILVMALKIKPDLLYYVINEKEAPRLIPNINNLLLLCLVIIVSQFLNGYIITKHKSPFIQFISGPYLKIGYLIICLWYLVFPFPFDLFLKLFVGLYLSSILIMFMYSLTLGFGLNFNFKNLNIRDLLRYGGFTILDKGSTLIVNNLDLVMIGILLNLDKVGYYSIAFFIGTVIAVPFRAIMTPATPLVSSFLKANKTQDLQKLYKQTSINQLVMGICIFTLIWVNINSLFALMPPNFAPGKWVVFYIGISKLFTLVSGAANAIIIYSKYYYYNMIFNLLLIGVTVGTNYILIQEYGIVGASMATAITFGVLNIAKMIFVNSKMDMQPITSNTFFTVIACIIVILIGSLIQLNFHPIINIAIQSSIVGVLLLGLFKVFGIKAEILNRLPVIGRIFA